jgi:hypothetical protein
MSNSASDRWSIQALARAAATIGVILSLLFVGLELRQSRQLARAEVRQGLADGNAQFISSISDNPELARAWLEMWGSNVSRFELTAVDSTQAIYAMFGMLRHVENVYLQYLEGVVDESVLTSYGFRSNSTLMLPQFETFWSGAKNRFDPRFVEALNTEYGL